MKILKFWKPIIILSVIIFFSLRSGTKLPKLPLFPHADKVAHACMYFGLSLFMVKPFQNIAARFPYFFSVLTCAVIGGLLEIGQLTLTQNRSGSWLDEIANISGAILGVLFFYFFIRNRKWSAIF